MENIEQLEGEIEKIKARNERVATDKAWETSRSRKVLIAALTYLVIVSFFLIANLPKPFISAIVPTIGFILSTLSIPVFKRIWMDRIYRDKIED